MEPLTGLLHSARRLVAAGGWGSRRCQPWFDKAARRGVAVPMLTVGLRTIWCGASTWVRGWAHPGTRSTMTCGTGNGLMTEMTSQWTRRLRRLAAGYEAVRALVRQGRPDLSCGYCADADCGIGDHKVSPKHLG